MVGGGILSGGIVFAIAAVLWLVYLIPTWVRRHEYMSAERNSVRLQQTLRILAETSELPDEVRFEATAREVAAQQKRLKRIEAERAAARKAESRAAIETVRVESQATMLRAKADARAAAARARAQAAEATERAAAEHRRARAKTRLMRSRRRSRLATTLFLVASAVTATLTGISAVSTGAWVLPALSTGGVVASIALLSRMAAVGSRVTRTADLPQMARPVEREIFDADLSEEEKATVERTWTPTSLPKPLHLEQGSVAAATLAAEASHTRLRQAAIAEAMAQKANKREPQAASIEERRVARDEQRTVQQPVEASPYASMGVVDEGEILAADLLRRRMAAG